MRSVMLWYYKYKLLNWKFDFGKHKGRTLKYVIDSDLQYVLWCVESNIFKIHIFSIPYMKKQQRLYNIKVREIRAMLQGLYGTRGDWLDDGNGNCGFIEDDIDY